MDISTQCAEKVLLSVKQAGGVASVSQCMSTFLQYIYFENSKGFSNQNTYFSIFSAVMITLFVVMIDLESATSFLDGSTRMSKNNNSVQPDSKDNNGGNDNP